MWFCPAGVKTLSCDVFLSNFWLFSFFFSFVFTLHSISLKHGHLFRFFCFCRRGFAAAGVPGAAFSPPLQAATSCNTWSSRLIQLPHSLVFFFFFFGEVWRHGIACFFSFSGVSSQSGRIHRRVSSRNTGTSGTFFFLLFFFFLRFFSPFFIFLGLIFLSLVLLLLLFSFFSIHCSLEFGDTLHLGWSRQVWRPPSSLPTWWGGVSSCVSFCPPSLPSSLSSWPPFGAWRPFGICFSSAFAFSFALKPFFSDSFPSLVFLLFLSFSSFLPFFLFFYTWL